MTGAEMVFQALEDNGVRHIFGYPGGAVLPIYDATGITLNEWQKKRNKKYFNSNEFIKICLIPSKSELEERIKKRFLDMLKKGAIEETKKI